MQKRFPLSDVLGVGKNIYIGRIRRWCMAHPQRSAWSVLAPLALGLLLLCAPAVLAAVQLNYFTVIPGPSSVVLEWSTATEVNVAGFDVQCKLANEPDSAFHEIGYVRAKGGPNVGALYSFPVSNLVPGTAYCFRLKEITTDGSPGEVFDRCGYGPGVTPTPGVPGSFPTFTPAPIVVPTDAFGNPILPTPPPAAPQPVATDAFGNPIPTPIPQPQAVPTDAFGNPIPTPFPQPGVVQTPPFVSPLPQPVATDAFGNPIPTPIPQPQAVPTDAFGNPIATPIPQPTAIPTDAFGNPIPTPIPQPTAIPTDAFGNPIPTPLPTAIPTDAFGNPIATPIPTPTVRVAESGAVDAFGSPLAAPANTGTGMTDAYGNPLPADPYQAMAAAPVDANAPPQQYAQVATPTTEYVVVTATPTPAPVALAPVLTPLPTVTPPAPGMQLADTLAPTTQNLMVMLLCLTFTGAGGIGILGLITSVMYMRARSSQREFFDRASTRRRL